MGLCFLGTNISSPATMGCLVLGSQPFIWEITVLGWDVNSVSRSLSKLVHLPYAAHHSTPKNSITTSHPSWWSHHLYWLRVTEYHTSTLLFLGKREIKGNVRELSSHWCFQAYFVEL